MSDSVSQEFSGTDVPWKVPVIVGALAALGLLNYFHPIAMTSPIQTSIAFVVNAGVVIVGASLGLMTAAIRRGRFWG